MPMQGPGPSQLSMTNSSMNMPSSSHGSMGGYNHSVPSSQSMPAQNQMTMSQGQPMGNYAPRPNMSMQPSQGNRPQHSVLFPQLQLLHTPPPTQASFLLLVPVHMYICTHTCIDSWIHLALLAFGAEHLGVGASSSSLSRL